MVVADDVESAGLSVRSLDTDFDSLSAFCSSACCLVVAEGGAGAAFFLVLVLGVVVVEEVGIVAAGGGFGLTAEANFSIHSVYRMEC